MAIYSCKVNLCDDTEHVIVTTSFSVIVAGSAQRAGLFPLNTLPPLFLIFTLSNVNINRTTLVKETGRLTIQMKISTNAHHYTSTRRIRITTASKGYVDLKINPPRVVKLS